MSRIDRILDPGLAIAVTLGLAGPVAALAPHAMVLVVALGGVWGFLAHWRRHRLPPRPGGPAEWALAALATLAAASALWSMDPHMSAQKATKTISLVLPMLMLAGVARSLSPADRWRAASWFGWGTLGGFALLVAELAMENPLYRLFNGLSRYDIISDNVQNRPETIFSILLWPAGLALARRGRPLLGLAAALYFALIGIWLEGQSAWIGLICGLVALVVAWLLPRLACWLALGGALGLLALMVPLTHWLYESGLSHQTGLMDSARHRIEIWYFVGGHVADHPWLGGGLSTARLLTLTPADGPWDFLDMVDKVRPIWHPHNNLLEVWFDLGALGAALLAVLLIALIRPIFALDRQARAFLIAGLGAAFVNGCAAFGLWQGWWLATLAVAAVAGSLVARGRAPD